MSLEVTKNDMYQIRFMANDLMCRLEGDYSLVSDGELELDLENIEEYMEKLTVVIRMVDKEVTKLIGKECGCDD
jgi:hypothetical protein